MQIDKLTLERSAAVTGSLQGPHWGVPHVPLAAVRAGREHSCLAAAADLGARRADAVRTSDASFIFQPGHPTVLKF